MNRFRKSTFLYLGLSCVLASFVLAGPLALADDWPQWRGLNRDGVWNESGVVGAFSTPQLKPVWRAEIANGYSGPTVADGRVYVTDRVTEPTERERVHAFDAATGEPLWTHDYACSYKGVSYPDGPRASVTIANGRAYSVGALGHVRCLDAKSGALIWHKEPGVDYEIELPIWGLTAAPLVEGGLVIAQIGGRPDACIVAWDAKTGEERWRALEDPTSYSAPIIIEQAGRRVLLCWTGANIVGLDPTSGETLWQHATEPSRIMVSIPTPVLEGEHLFLTSFYDGSFMFRLPKNELVVEEVWHRRGRNEKRTDALHSMIGTPLMQGDYVYGVDSYGQLRCLDAKTGDRIWEDLTAVPEERWATIHMVKNGEHVWMFNDRGELIISKLSPEGFEEISRTKLIEPTAGQYTATSGQSDREEDAFSVAWSHPAFANRHIFIRNDNELICASLAAE